MQHNVDSIKKKLSPLFPFSLTFSFLCFGGFSDFILLKGVVAAQYYSKIPWLVYIVFFLFSFSEAV